MLRGPFAVCKVVPHDQGARILCRDERTQLALEYEIEFDAHSGVLRIRFSLTNYRPAPLDLYDMMTACLPVPDGMIDIIGFAGLWTQEFTQERVKRNAATYLRENRSGRTSARR